MAVKIRLKRMGKIRAPFYRVVVADARTRRDGRAIEEIGKYHPTEEPSRIEIESDRVQYWLGVGAQPTPQVANLLRITGDWQKFKGEPGAEGTLKVAAAKQDRKALYEAEMRQAKSEPEAEATTARRGRGKGRGKGGASTETAQADGAQADGAQADGAPADGAPVDGAPTEAAATETQQG